MSSHKRVLDRFAYARVDDELLRRANLHAYKAVNEAKDGEDTLKIYKDTVESFGFVWAPAPICRYVIPEGVEPDIPEISVKDIGKQKTPVFSFYLSGHCH